MKTIAIIPARGNSKRLPKKNIKTLGGIPLLVHSINYAKQFVFIDDIYVSTDCNDIKAIALKFGAKVVERPKELSGDLEPTVTALKHVIETLDNTIETIILLQPTNPLRPNNLLQEAYTLYINKNCNSLFTVSRNYHKFGKIDKGVFKPFNYKPGQRSQDLEPLYFENGLLYITKAEYILNNKIITEDAFPLEIDHPFANIDIDTQDDFDYAEHLYNKHINE
ncbi:cytidylyltransferase domain-containing protein [Olleya namhaensis]|uniref:acylneuraminate cytidylyltransferase family protein n=1 Tax=Olleya namhaensis TaxID=1144750 RepID=UPI002491EB82|nr:acylneuraminate cytidylyltransferase family protein [Olleya namhaensis]